MSEATVDVADLRRSGPGADERADEAPLREDIRLLGRVLGEVIEEQAGRDVFELVESTRIEAFRVRRSEVDREAVPVPANEHRKITFEVDPAAGVSPDAQVCTAVLSLQLSTRMVVRIPFDLHRMPGADQFDLPGPFESWNWGSGEYWGRHPRWAKSFTEMFQTIGGLRASR